MAKNKENILGKILNLRDGIKRPAGDKTDEEIQYSNTDLLLGITAVSMFGNKFRSTNHTNINTVLGKMSFPEIMSLDIKSIQSVLVPFIKTMNKAISQKSNLIALQTSIKDMPLVNLSENTIEKLNKIFSQNTTEVTGTKNNDNIAKIILDIENSTNFNNLIESFKELQKISYNEEVEKIQNIINIIDEINKIPEIISVNELNNFIAELSKFDLKSIISSDFVNNINELETLLNNINNTTVNYKQVVSKIYEIINDISQIKLNDILEIDKEKLVNLSKFGELFEQVNNIIPKLNINQQNNLSPDSIIGNIQLVTNFIDKLKAIDTSNIKTINSQSISDINDYVKSIIDLHNTLTNISNANTLEEFKLDEFIDNIKGLSIDKKDIDTIITNVNALTELFGGGNNINNKTSFNKLFEAINKTLVNDKQENIFTQSLENINGLGSLINAIITISTVDKEVNVDFLDTLVSVTSDGGQIKSIMDNLNKISEEKINLTHIRAIRDYFDAIASLGEIGLRKKLRIITNLAFYKYYVSKSLPSLINQFDKSFKNVNLVDKGSTLDNLSRYFDAIGDITTISFKDKLKIISSMSFMHFYLIDQMGKLVEDVNKAFSQKTIDDSVNNIMKFFESLSKISFSANFEEQQKALTHVEEFIFGSAFGRGANFGKLGKFVGKVNSLFGEASIYGILLRLQGLDITSAKTSIDNLKEVLQFIKSSLLSFNLSPDILEDKKEALEIFQNDIISILAKLNKETSNIESGLNTLKVFNDQINTIFGKSTFNDTLQKLNIDSKMSFIKNLVCIDLLISFFNNLKNNNIKNKLEILEEFKEIDNIFKDKSAFNDTLQKLNINNRKSLLKSLLFLEALVPTLVQLAISKKLIRNGIEAIGIFHDIKNKFGEERGDSLETFLGYININDKEAILSNFEFLKNLVKQFKKISLSEKSIGNGVDSLKEIANKINEIFGESSLNESIQKLVVKDIEKNIDNFSIFIEGFLKSTELLNTNKEEFINGTETLIEICKKINEQFSKKEDLNKSFTKLAVTKESLKKIENTEKALKYIEIFGNILSKINKIKFDTKNTQKIASNIKTLIDSFKDIDEKKIKQVNNIFKSIYKLIIGTALILVLGSLVMTKVNLSGLLKFGAGMLMMTSIIGGILYAINKLNIDEKKIENINIIFKEVGKLILFSSIVLFVGSLIASKIEFESIGKFLAGSTVIVLLTGGLIFIINNTNLTKAKVENATKLLLATGALILASSIGFLTISFLSNKLNWQSFLINLALFGAVSIAYIGIVYGITYLLNKRTKITELGKTIVILMQMSTIVLLLSSALMLASVAATLASPAHILAFGAGLTLLILGITPALIFVKTPLFKLGMSSATSLGILILMLSASLLLGAFIAQSIPIPIIVTFGILLSVLITSLTLPLIALSITGKAALKGGKDLGVLILYATIGLGIGALFMMIPGMKEKIEEFAGVYTGFLFKLLLAVGLCSLLAKHGLDGINSVNKIIKSATITLLLGGLLFTLWPELKDGVTTFTTILGIFIVGIVGVVGIAARLGGKAISKMWQISLLVLISSGVLLTAGYLMKDNPSLLGYIAGFTFITLVLIGGIVAIIKTLSKISIKKLITGILAIGVIELLIFGMAHVFKYMASISMNLNQALQLGILALCMLGIISMFLLAAWGIGFLVIKMKLIMYIGAGMLAIGAAGLLLWGISYIFKYIKDNLMDYDVGKLWDITGSMLGVIAMFLLGAGVIGAIGFVVWPFLLVGGIIIGLSGLLLWGMAWLFGQVLAIDKKWDFIGNGGNGNFEDSKIYKVINTLFDATEHILKRLYNLQTGDNKITSFIKGIPVVGSLVGNAMDALTLFPNLAIAAAGIIATTGICANLAVLIGCMKLVGNNPIEDIDKAANMIEAILKIYTNKSILEQINSIKGNVETLEFMAEMSKKLAEVIYDISLGIKNYAELRIEEIGDDGKPTGKFRQFTDKDFENAGKNIAEIITCVGGSIMALFGIGPKANLTTAGQQAIAKEMLQVEDGGWFRSKKTKFGMVLEASAGLGKVINEIAKGVMQWSKLPSGFDANESAKNIATIITTVGGAILSLIGDGPKTTEFITKDNEFKVRVVNEMLQTVSGGFLGLGSKKTKFGMILEASEHLGVIIKKIAEGVMQWSKIPPEIFSKQGAKSAKDNIKDIITTIGGAIIDLYTGKDLDSGSKEVAKEMFEAGPWYNRSNTKFTIVANSVGKLGEMISNIATGVQSYANLKIPTKFDEKGNPIEWKPMKPEDFKQAQENIGKIITTIGDAIIKVGESPAFNNIFGFQGDRLKIIAESIAKVSQVIGPVAQSIGMYAKGKFPLTYYKNGKLETEWVSGNSDNIDNLVKKAKENMSAVLVGFSESVEDALRNNKLDKIYNNKKLEKFSNAITTISKLINNTSNTLKNVIKLAITTSQISTNISNPFNEFISGIFPLDENSNKGKLLSLIKDDDISKYMDGIKKGASDIVYIFNSLNNASKSSKDISKNMQTIQSIIKQYIDMYTIISTFAINSYSTSVSENLKQYNKDVEEILETIQKVRENDYKNFNILKEGFKGLFAVIAGIKNNKNFSEHVKNIKSYVDNTNKLDLIKIKSLTNLVDAINKFGENFGNIDDFTNAIVEKLTKSLEHLTGSLTEAKDTIDKVDKLHDNRKKLIQKSVDDIKSLFNKELTVNIKEKKEEEQKEQKPLPDPGRTAGDGGATSFGGNSLGGGFAGGGFGGGLRGDNSQESETDTKQTDLKNNMTYKQTYNSSDKEINVEIDAKELGGLIAQAIKEAMNKN